jgi:phage host-nuclease inhibitor protein Gam
MTKSKTKLAAVAVKVPQSRAEAAEALRLIGERHRQIGRIEADMNDELAKAKERAEDAAAPLRASAQALMEGLKVWCEANRSTILDARTKTADLGTGTVSWRRRPPSVKLTAIEAVIEACRRMGYARFLRDKTEVNKEAMLAEQDVARLVPGVSIKSVGEEFIAEPFEAELAGAA